MSTRSNDFIPYLNRGTISWISFSFLISSSLAGAQRVPIIPMMNSASLEILRAPFSASCLISSKSSTSVIWFLSLVWPGSKKDKSVWGEKAMLLLLIPSNRIMLYAWSLFQTKWTLWQQYMTVKRLTVSRVLDWNLGNLGSNHHWTHGISLEAAMVNHSLNISCYLEGKSEATWGHIKVIHS